MRISSWQIAVALGLVASATWVSAQTGGTVDAPTFKVGDSWLFDDVSEKGPTGYSETHADVVIERLNDTTMSVGVKKEGAPTAFEDHLVGADWSERRFLDGHDVVTARPLEFPLTVGHTWTVDFIDPTRRGNQISLKVHRTYSAVGWEDLTVPAGRFHAMKIVAESVDEAMIQVPASAGSGIAAADGATAGFSHSQRGGVGKLVRLLHSEFYYVPGIRNSVRNIEEQYNPDHILVSRQTRNLLRFTPSA